MPLDTSIPLQATVPSLDTTLKPISSLLGIQQQQQALQQQRQQIQAGQQTLQSNAIDLQEKQAVQQLLSDPKNFTDDQGNIDWNKAAPAMMKVAPVNGPKYLQGLFATQEQATSAKSALNQLDAQTRSQVGQFVTSLAGRPPEEILQGLQSLKQAFPNLSGAVDFFGQKVIGPVAQMGDDKKLQDTVWRIGRSIETPSTQQAMATPGGVGVSDNQHSAVVSTKPGTAVPPGEEVPGTGVQMQLPPNTPVMGGPSGTTPGYLGSREPAPMRNNNPGALMPNGKLAQFKTPEEGIAALDNNLINYGKQGVSTLSDAISKWAPPNQNNTQAYIDDVAKRTGLDPHAKIDLTNPYIIRQISAAIISHENGKPAPSNAFVASGLPVGQAGNIENNVQEMNRHFSGLQDQASGNQLVQSLQGNIKSLAHSAVTGTESAKLAYVNGLLARLPGFAGQPSTDLKTATDILEKNLSQLNLSTPASTDAARVLVSAARPHSSMTPEAIDEAVDQVASQVKANTAIRNFLSPYKQMGDTNGYQSARQRIEQVADPRVWQYESLDPKGRAAFMKRLQPADQQQLIQKAKQLESMGIIN